MLPVRIFHGYITLLLLWRCFRLGSGRRFSRRIRLWNICLTRFFRRYQIAANGLLLSFFGLMVWHTPANVLSVAACHDAAQQGSRSRQNA